MSEPEIMSREQWEAQNAIPDRRDATIEALHDALGLAVPTMGREARCKEEYEEDKAADAAVAKVKNAGWVSDG